MQDPSSKGEMDATTFVFGSSEAYDAFMEAYLLGEVEDLNQPEPGAIALYFDEEDNVVHIGRVDSDAEGLVVRSMIMGRVTPFVTPPDQYPLPEIVRVSWAEPLSTDTNE